MRNLLRQNATIVLSIALPVVVLALFMAATWIPRMLVDPPAHDIVLASDGSYPRTGTLPFSIDLYVNGGRLRARAQLDETGNTSRYIDPPRIFIYSAGNRTMREVAVELPDNLDSVADGQALSLPDNIAQLELSTSLTSPDGWEFDNSRTSGGLFTELFGGGYRGNEARIRKNGASIELAVPGERNTYYPNTRLIGWVLQ